MESFTVKQARLFRGYTQMEIAQKLGISLDTYRNIEQKPEKTTIERAEKFSNIVGIPLDKIIFFNHNST